MGVFDDDEFWFIDAGLIELPMQTVPDFIP